MTYRNLDEFVIRLEQHNELVQIHKPVHPDLEIAEITVAMASRPPARNKALLFTHVIGSDFPVVTNLFGTARRMAWALGVEDLAEIEQKMDALFSFDFSQGFGGMLSRLSSLMSALRSTGMGSSHATGPGVQEMRLTQPDMTTLPILRSWPGEPYRTITHAQLVLQTRDSRQVINTSVIVLDRQTLGIPLEATYTDSGAIPAAVVLGGDPAAIWSASVPLPTQIDPYWLAGWLRNRPLPMTSAMTQPLQIPANAEIIIEGCLTPAERFEVQNLAGRDGFYIPHKTMMTLRVTGMTHRKGAIYPAAVIPHEQHWPQKATERFFLPIMKTLHDEVTDFAIPAEGAAHHLAVVSIQKRYPGQVQKVMYGLWGLGKLALTKAIVIVDADTDIHDTQAVLRAMAQHVDWGQDIVRLQGPLSEDDHTTSTPGFGGKIGIDATRKAGRLTASPSSPLANDALTALVGENWRTWCSAVVIVGLDDQVTPTSQLLDTLREACPDQHLILVDSTLNLDNMEAVLRHILASVDWQHDMTIQPTHHSTYDEPSPQNRVIINALRRHKGLSTPLR